ncbi:MAG: hypothetical protein QM820_54785 [Minicystis sp.]
MSQPRFLSEAMMSDLRFDPSKAVTFDLAHGLVHLEGAPSRLLVPADALAPLIEAAGPAAAAAFGRSIGEAMGRRVASRLHAEGVGAAAVDVVVEHLGGELALTGLGSLGLERWGRALVLVVDQSPLGAGGDALLEAALAGAVETAAGRSVRALLLGRDGVRARFFVGGEAGTEKVKGWLAQGISWGDALVRLHAPVEAKVDARRGEGSEA